MPRGGKRPGAGAPIGNFNALKHGMRTPRGHHVIATLLVVPETRRFLLSLVRNRRGYPSAPPCALLGCPHRVRPVSPEARKRAIISYRTLLRVARILGVEPAALPAALVALSQPLSDAESGWERAVPPSPHYQLSTANYLRPSMHEQSEENPFPESGASHNFSAQSYTPPGGADPGPRAEAPR